MADGRNEIARAEIARQLLEDPVMAEAFETAEGKFVKEWRESADLERREMAWAKVQALDEVRRVLRTVLNKGQYAALKGSD
jgi:hypothetical protein